MKPANFKNRIFYKDKSGKELNIEINSDIKAFYNKPKNSQMYTPIKRRRAPTWKMMLDYEPKNNVMPENNPSKMGRRDQRDRIEQNIKNVANSFEENAIKETKELLQSNNIGYFLLESDKTIENFSYLDDFLYAYSKKNKKSLNYNNSPNENKSDIDFLLYGLNVIELNKLIELYQQYYTTIVDNKNKQLLKLFINKMKYVKNKKISGKPFHISVKLGGFIKKTKKLKN